MPLRFIISFFLYQCALGVGVCVCSSVDCVDVILNECVCVCRLLYGGTGCIDR